MVADLLVDPSKGWLKLQSDYASSTQRLSATVTVSNCSLRGGKTVVFLAEATGSGGDAAHLTVEPDFGTLPNGPKHAQQITVTADVTAKQLHAESSGQLGWLLLHHATVSSGSTISRRGFQGAVSRQAAGQQPPGFLLEVKRLLLVSCWRGSAPRWLKAERCLQRRVIPVMLQSCTGCTLPPATSGSHFRPHRNAGDTGR